MVWKHDVIQKNESTSHRNAVRGGPSHGHREHVPKNWWFSSCASGQTDRQTEKNIHITILHTPPDLWCFDFWQYQISLLMQLKAFRSPTWLWRGWCEDCLILLVACSATSGPPILQHQARLGLCFRSRYSYWHTRLLASVYNRFWSNAAVFLCQIELSACYRKLAYLPPYQMTQVDSVLFNLQITEINSFT